DLERNEEWHVRVPALAGPHRRLWAGAARRPDRRMRLLQGQAPRVDVPEVVVASLPAEGPRLRPAFQDQVVTLLEAPAVVDGIRVGQPGIDADAPTEAAETSAPRAATGP